MQSQLKRKEPTRIDLVRKDRVDPRIQTVRK